MTKDSPPEVLPEKPDSLAEAALAPVNFQGINISGDTVTLKTADYPEEQRALVRWLFSFARDQRMTWSDIEAASDISTTVLHKIWNGKYKYEDGRQVPLDNICEKIARFKGLAEERAYTDKLPFVETSVWRRVDKLCRETLIMQTIAFVYGESQIGKTASLKEHVRRNNHGSTIYVLCPASGGVQSLLKAIAEACHISPKSSFDHIRDRVANYLDHSKLLILDEVHEVFGTYQKTSVKRCMSVLRQLQETTQCAMILCGTNDFRTELERGEWSQALKQLRKRGIWELQLESTPTSEDLGLIAKHYRLGEPKGEAAEHVAWIAKEMGLGKYTKFMARSSQLASKKGEKFTWDHFVRTVSIAAKLKQQQQ